MAATLTSFTPSTATASLRAHASKPDPKQRKSGSATWWTPLFKWSSQPDYITNSSSTSENQPENLERKSKFMPGCFTEEKAKQLRMNNIESSSFHDVMHHSAIASRLASDIQGFGDM